FGELVGQSGNPTVGFTHLRSPGLLPECRVFSRFSREFSFRMLISEKVSRGRSDPPSAASDSRTAPDSLFGKRGATQELTRRRNVAGEAASVQLERADRFRHFFRAV